MTTKRQRAASRAHRPPPIPTNVIVAGNAQPLMELVIYDTLVLRRQLLPGNRIISTPIDPAAVAQVFTRVPSASGLLPRDTLGTGRVHGTPYFALWIPPGVRRLQVVDRFYTIPLPPLVWCGSGTDYRVWALGHDDYPMRADVGLWCAPLPNCYTDGRICWGNVQHPPVATPETLRSTLALFLEESAFNLHVAEGKSVAYPRSVLARWRDLEEAGAEAYPLDDMVSAERTLAWALAGGPWGGSK